MSYMHIQNLYKNQIILLFRECYALEKIHGTSAHISWKIDGGIRFFAGGVKHSNFVALFDENLLAEKLGVVGQDVVVYGEAYGGKCQGMSATYGKDLKFVVFDVKIGNRWLSVPQAEEFAKECNLEFVDYEKVSTDLKSLDIERDKPSVQAVRNGITESRKREGVVLRPLIELTTNNGERIIVKHKGEDFQETKTKRKVIDPVQLKILENAQAVADEWVTEMRLTHVLDKTQDPSLSKMREIIDAMIKDIQRESKGEVVWSREVQRVISKVTATMAKKRLTHISH